VNYGNLLDDASVELLRRVVQEVLPASSTDRVTRKKRRGAIAGDSDSHVWLGQARADIDTGNDGNIALNADDAASDEVTGNNWGMRCENGDDILIFQPRNPPPDEPLYYFLARPACYGIQGMFGVSTAGPSQEQLLKFHSDGTCTTEGIEDCPDPISIPSYIVELYSSLPAATGELVGTQATVTDDGGNTGTYVVTGAAPGNNGTTWTKL